MPTGTRVFPVFAPFPPVATSFTTAPPIFVFHHGVDHALCFGLGGCSCLVRRMRASGGSMAASSIVNSFRTPSLNWGGLRSSMNTLLNNLPAADFHAPHMLPVSFKMDQQLDSVTVLRLACHVDSTRPLTSFALLGDGTVAAATCRRLYIATALMLRYGRTTERKNSKRSASHRLKAGGGEVTQIRDVGYSVIVMQLHITIPPSTTVPFRIYSLHWRINFVASHWCGWMPSNVKLWALARFRAGLA